MMPSPAFGPTIWNECAAAGIPAGVVQMFAPLDVLNPDGSLLFPAGTVIYTAAATAEQRAAVQAVVAAHDPTKQLPATATGDSLLKALTDAQAALIKPRDIARLSARGLDAIPISNSVVVRASARAGTTPDAWFQLALAPGS